MFSRVYDRVCSAVIGFFSPEISPLDVRPVSDENEAYFPSERISEVEFYRLSILTIEPSERVRELTAENHFLFRKAVKNFTLYSIVRSMLIDGGYGSFLPNLLNTSLPEEFFGEQISCTPLMMLIYETISNPPADYTNFTMVLVQLYNDGALLTDTQIFSIRECLNRIKKRAAPDFIELLNQWMDALPKTEKQELPNQEEATSTSDVMINIAGECDDETYKIEELVYMSFCP
jgi:hypothetical protein